MASISPPRPHLALLALPPLAAFVLPSFRILPVLRQDALRATDQSGNLLATVFVHGIGQAPQLSIYPGIISTFAGNGAWAYVTNANPASASFRNPQSLAIDPLGNVFIADSVNQVIRKVAAANGAVSTIVGNGKADYKGDGGPASAASLNTPTSVALDAAGNLYIADQGNNVIREVNAVTGIIRPCSWRQLLLNPTIWATVVPLPAPSLTVRKALHSILPATSMSPMPIINSSVS